MIITEKTNRRPGCLGSLGWLIVIVTITIIGCMSCSKNIKVDNRYKYEMIIDWHNLDKTMRKPRAYVQDLGVLNPAEVATFKEMWYVNCDQPDVLDHLYYKIK